MSLLCMASGGRLLTASAGPVWGIIDTVMTFALLKQGYVSAPYVHSQEVTAHFPHEDGLGVLLCESCLHGDGDGRLSKPTGRYLAVGCNAAYGFRQSISKDREHIEDVLLPRNDACSLSKQWLVHFGNGGRGFSFW